jgi:hypothetical protein
MYNMMKFINAKFIPKKRMRMCVGIDVFAQCQQNFFEISVFKRSNIAINDTANW